MDVYQKGWKPPVQDQTRPGLQRELNPPPVDDRTADGKPYKAAGKFEGKNAIVTGADSGISSFYSDPSSMFIVRQALAEP